MNSLCVPRVAKEAIGAICCLQQPDGTSVTINVEYNQLDALLRDSGYPDGAHLGSHHVQYSHFLPVLWMCHPTKRHGFGPAAFHWVLVSLPGCRPLLFSVCTPASTCMEFCRTSMSCWPTPCCTEAISHVLCLQVHR
jgi:hypothetical protein